MLKPYSNYAQLFHKCSLQWVCPNQDSVPNHAFIWLCPWHLLNFRTLFFLISRYTDLLKKVGQLFSSMSYFEDLPACLPVVLFTLFLIIYIFSKLEVRSKGLSKVQSGTLGWYIIDDIIFLILYHDRNLIITDFPSCNQKSWYKL